jgi:tRNA A-37 threonylcarbamoyl transferase component Bud32
MAELFLAEATGVHQFRKYFAVKRILPQWTTDREFVEMFLDEARLAAQLDHPNVVHVHDIGEDDAGPFFAMDYIHGENLLQVMRACRASGRRIPDAVVVAIVAAAAAGLQHAHERRGFDGRPLGIVHRDVSPTNVIATYEGITKIVDFGIAKASTSRHATRPSVRKGKMAYMSPEQCRGDALDARSDVFALGVVLYEMLTLTRAYSGESEYAVMNAIVNHDIEPPSSRFDGIRPEMDEITLRALQRDRDERFSDARGLQLALEEFAAHARLTATPAAIAEFMAELFGERPYPWEGEAPAAASDSRAVRPPVSRDDVPTRVADPRAQVLPASTTPRWSVVPWAAGLGVVAVTSGVAWWWMKAAPSRTETTPPIEVPVASSANDAPPPREPAEPEVVPESRPAVATPVETEESAPKVDAPAPVPVPVAPASDPAPRRTKPKPNPKPSVSDARTEPVPDPGAAFDPDAPPPSRHAE